MTLLAGCSPNEGGRPRPMLTPSEEPTAATSAGAPPPSLRDLDACALLNTALKGKQFPPAEDSDIGSENGCRSNKRGNSTALDLDDQQGVDDVQAAPARIHDGRINGRRIVQVKENGGTAGMCQVLLEVSTKSRAMVTVTLGSRGDTDQACAEAMSTADALEPQLPQAR
ncbi:DUF3558 family protein [Amycolatopsis magusensis]|uniref:DUF3558 family protein n=1 Tax=Amycolatopsis magusensis TaxID=882444 RepID=UPI0037AD8E4B